MDSFFLTHLETSFPSDGKPFAEVDPSVQPGVRVSPKLLVRWTELEMSVELSLAGIRESSRESSPMEGGR